MAHIKTSEGYDVKIPSKGQLDYATVAGSLGIASFLGLNAGNVLGGGLLGGGGRMPVCSEDHLVTRYDLEQEQKLAAKDSEIALLKANTYQDQKTLELFRYVDGKFSLVEAQLAEQRVRNQGVADAIREVNKDIDYKVALEAERRQCSDQRIIAYVNGTFAPKAVADYTAGTTTTPMPTYNPLCCDCGGGNPM